MLEQLTCPLCGDAQDRGQVCQSRAREIPPSCPHASDQAEYALWSGELYHTEDGRLYKPVTHRDQFGRNICDVEATLKGPEVFPPKDRLHFHHKCGKCGYQWVEHVKIKEAN